MLRCVPQLCQIISTRIQWRVFTGDFVYILVSFCVSFGIFCWLLAILLPMPVQVIVCRESCLKWCTMWRVGWWTLLTYSWLLFPFLPTSELWWLSGR